MAAEGSPASRLTAAAPQAGRGRHPVAAVPRCAAATDLGTAGGPLGGGRGSLPSAAALNSA